MQFSLLTQKDALCSSHYCVIIFCEFFCYFYACQCGEKQKWLNGNIKNCKSRADFYDSLDGKLGFPEELRALPCKNLQGPMWEKANKSTSQAKLDPHKTQNLPIRSRWTNTCESSNKYNPNSEQLKSKSMKDLSFVETSRTM